MLLDASTMVKCVLCDMSVKPARFLDPISSWAGFHGPAVGTTFLRMAEGAPHQSGLLQQFDIFQVLRSTGFALNRQISEADLVCPSNRDKQLLTKASCHGEDLPISETDSAV